MPLYTLMICMRFDWVDRAIAPDQDSLDIFRFSDDHNDPWQYVTRESLA